MPENGLQAIAEAGVAAHQRFVDDNREIDLAWADGRLDEWIQEKLADERNAAGFDPVDQKEAT